MKSGFSSALAISSELYFPVSSSKHVNDPACLPQPTCKDQVMIRAKHTPFSTVNYSSKETPRVHREYNRPWMWAGKTCIKVSKGKSTVYFILWKEYPHTKKRECHIIKWQIGWHHRSNLEITWECHVIKWHKLDDTIEVI